MDVFTEQEALTFLAARTGRADAAGAQALAAEVGCLPLALAQAAAVIAASTCPMAPTWSGCAACRSLRCWSRSRPGTTRAGWPRRCCCRWSMSAQVRTGRRARR